MGKRFLVLGDSHTHTFRKIEDENTYIVKCVPGATAIGCMNEKNHTKSLAQFLEILQERSHDCDYAVIMLGEIDCNYLIWFKHERLGADVWVEIDRSINTLAQFVKEHVEPKFTKDKIIVVGPQLPKVKNNRECIPAWQRNISTTLDKRTNLTIKYCEKLLELCMKNSYNYVDIMKETLDTETGLLADRFLYNNENDIHIQPSLVGPIYSNTLRRFA